MGRAPTTAPKHTDGEAMRLFDGILFDMEACASFRSWWLPARLATNSGCCIVFLLLGGAAVGDPPTTGSAQLACRAISGCRYLPCCARMMASILGSNLDSSVPGGRAVTPQAGPGGGPAGSRGGSNVPAECGAGKHPAGSRT